MEASKTILAYAASLPSETPAIPQGWKPDPEGPWVVWYEDAEQPPQLYFGAGAEEAARRHYNSALTSWNVHLLAAAPDGKEGG